MDMLNRCGHALSQGDGSDFDPSHNWEAAPPGHSAHVRAWSWFIPCHGATPVWTNYGSQERLEKYGNAGRCGRLWEESEMGTQRNIGAGI